MIRKTLMFLGALAALIGFTAVLPSPAANAAVNGYNCVSRSEQDTLRVGNTPRQVRVKTDAQPWFSMPIRENGKRYFAEAYSDCNYSTGKEFVAIYNIRKDGSRHLFMHRYMNL